MAISLLSLSTTQSMRPPLLTVYGTAGVGKTTFGFSAPNPVGLLTEDGLGLIQATVFPLFRTLPDFLAGMDALINEPHDFETAVIDSLDWLEPLIWAEVCRQQGINSIEEVGYGKGYTFAIDLWRNEYIARLNRLRDERGMGVVQIAQRTLSAICHAIGRMQVSDSEERHVQPLLVKVAVGPSGYNEVKGYKPANQQRQPAPPVQTPPGPAPQQAPAAYQAPRQQPVPPPNQAVQPQPAPPVQTPPGPAPQQAPAAYQVPRQQPVPPPNQAVQPQPMPAQNTGTVPWRRMG